MAAVSVVPAILDFLSDEVRGDDISNSIKQISAQKFAAKTSGYDIYFSLLSNVRKITHITSLQASKLT